MTNLWDLTIVGIALILGGIFCLFIAPRFKRGREKSSLVELRVSIGHRVILQIDTDSLANVIRYSGQNEGEWVDLLYGRMTRIKTIHRAEMGEREMEIEARVIAA